MGFGSPLKQRVRDFLRAGVGVVGLLCLLIGFPQRTDKLPSVSLTGGNFTTWSKVPPISHRDQGYRVPIFPDNDISKGWHLGPPERHSWVIKLVKGFFFFLQVF